MEEEIIAKNKQYWDDHADFWFGTILHIKKIQISFLKIGIAYSLIFGTTIRDNALKSLTIPLKLHRI